MVAVGAVIGIVVGLSGNRLIAFTGVTSADLPPLTAPSPEPEEEPTEQAPAEEPSPAAEPEAPQPRLETDSTEVPPGQRFRLRGAIPAADPGDLLQVQTRDTADQPWVDFPVTTSAGAEGSFETTVYTSRTGARQFRLVIVGTEVGTPTLDVVIG